MKTNVADIATMASSTLRPRPTREAGNLLSCISASSGGADRAVYGDYGILPATK
jgi:hypothetical protein